MNLAGSKHRFVTGIQPTFETEQMFAQMRATKQNFCASVESIRESGGAARSVQSENPNPPAAGRRVCPPLPVLYPHESPLSIFGEGIQG
jgi:hypothetical protein